MSSSQSQTLTSFTGGDIVVSVVGDVNDSSDYTDNQAAPIALEEVTTTGTEVGQLVLPETTTTVDGTTENAISGEYGSSSEGLLQLAANGESLVIGGYGVNAATFNTGGAAVFGSAALAQSTSFLNSSFTPVARVVADISYNANVDTSTTLFGVFNTNNIRSVATVNGTSFYVSGQGVKGDTTQGVFLAHDGANSATSIDDTTDTREVEIVNGMLFVSRDSTQGAGGTSNIANYGTLLPVSTTTAEVLPGISGTVTLTAAQENSVDGSDVGSVVNLSPESFFFANATTLYVADGGAPKEGGLGDGGLQKWSFEDGKWVLDYTLSTGLNLVPNTETAGTSGLIGLTGEVVGNSVELFATNSTIGDLDPTFLFGITDSLSATTLPTDESFTTLVTAAPDTNIRGVSFAPTSATTTPTSTTVSSGSPLSGATITSGSSFTVLSGGTATDTTLLSGATGLVSSGGTDISATIAHGATETVLGSATGDQVDGTQIVSAASAIVSDETVFNGGSVDLFLKGALSDDITLTNGGTLAISGNASATDTVISNGGLVELESPKAVLLGGLTFIGSGSLEETATISSGFGASATISGFGSSNVIDLTTISGATFSAVSSGGETIATVTEGKNVETFVFAGNIASSLSLVSDGGTGEEITFTPPTPVNSTVSSGSVQSDLTVSSGGTLTVAAGGEIISTTVLSGGSLIVNGIDSATTISSGGSETLLGSANGDQIFGTQLISAATAVATGETVFGGGVIDLFLKGGIVLDAVVSSGGELNVSGNAFASNTVLTNGGVLDLQSPKANADGTLTFSGAAKLEETAIVSSGFGVGATISGFGAGDTIDLTLFGSNSILTSAVVSGNTVETVTSGGDSESFTFAGTFGANFFALQPDSGSGVEITASAPCFRMGTRILTERGQVAVEALRVGDVLITASGDAQPITWIGHREIACRRHAERQKILPVRVAAGAFGDNRPMRDLYLSPDHAVFAEQVLIPVKHLINGTTIQQIDVEMVVYFHIELAAHDIVLAEGLPAESYLDTGDRDAFANGGNLIALHPSWASEARDVSLVMEALGAAPLRVVGAEVDRVKAHLTSRATGAAMGEVAAA
jgi:autotransporter passenger strand-loop-strand repeat protein